MADRAQTDWIDRLAEMFDGGEFFDNKTTDYDDEERRAVKATTQTAWTMWVTMAQATIV